MAGCAATGGGKTDRPRSIYQIAVVIALSVP